MNKKILTAILISISLPGSMLSAPADSLRLESYKLDEVVVTGTRSLQPREERAFQQRSDTGSYNRTDGHRDDMEFEQYGGYAK